MSSGPCVLVQLVGCMRWCWRDAVGELDSELALGWGYRSSDRLSRKEPSVYNQWLVVIGDGIRCLQYHLVCQHSKLSPSNPLSYGFQLVLVIPKSVHLSYPAFVILLCLGEVDSSFDVFVCIASGRTNVQCSNIYSHPPSPLSVGIGSVTLVFALTSDVAPKRKYQFPLLRCKLPQAEKVSPLLLGYDPSFRLELPVIYADF